MGCEREVIMWWLDVRMLYVVGVGVRRFDVVGLGVNISIMLVGWLSGSLFWLSVSC